MPHIEMEKKGNKPLHPNGGGAMVKGINPRRDRGKNPPLVEADSLWENNRNQKC